MSGLINKPILIAHPNAPAVGRNLEYIFDDGLTQEPYYMGSDGIPHKFSVTQGGITHASTINQTPNDHHNQVHDFAGADHNAATLSEVNSKISDATLDDSSASRTPLAHTIVSHDTTATGAELDTLTDGSNADLLHDHAIEHSNTLNQTANDHHNQVHDFAGVDHNAATLAQVNAKISDATLDDSSASRTPLAHTIASHDTTATGTELDTLTDGSNADTLHTHSGVGIITHASTTGQTADDHHNQVHDFAGADHNAATLAQVNAKISDATLDDSSATRTPSAHTIASHDTTATGANLDTLTNGSITALHSHATGADSLPAAIAGVITLADNKAYTLIGATNIGTNRIVFGINSSIRGYDPQKDIITYTGTGNMFTSIVNGFLLDNIGISCANGTMIQATNIDYTINPSVDPFQGRNRRFSITRCNLVGGGNGLGSRIGFLEGYSTCNFNANVITNWDIGFELSNCLSFEGLNNKSVLWNDQASTMITLRSNNWSGQTGGVGSYIPTGINAFNFNGNILHPRTSGYAASIDPASTTALGNIAGNIFITTGITTGGIFDTASVGFNELPTYNIQANTGIPDNTPTIQASIDRLQGYITVINTQNVLEKINFGNTIHTTSNLLISNRLLVTSVTGFLVDEIVTGGTSGFTGKIESIDAVNNYIYIKYIVDGLGVDHHFTVGETITGGTSLAATTYNGVDGSFKYYGAKEISIRFIATITLEKVGNGRDTFEIVPVKNGVALDDLSTVTFLEGLRPRDGVAQAITPFSNGDILELHIRNVDDVANCICQGLVFNISGR